MVETQLISIGHDFFESSQSWEKYSKLKLENELIDIFKIGDIARLLEMFFFISEKHKKLRDKNSELTEENRILKDQLRKHACFEICEKRLQKYD